MANVLALQWHRRTSPVLGDTLRLGSPAAALPAARQARGSLSPTSGAPAPRCRSPGQGEEEKPPTALSRCAASLSAG